MNLRWSILFALLSGCATAPPPAPIVAHAPRVEAAVAPEPADEPEPAREVVTIHGLTGSLTANEAESALAPRTAQFAACFTSRSEAFHELGGQVRLYIRVARDGAVAEVFPEDSTVGDREVERCLTNVARATRFPRPRGGEAILRWPISMDPAELTDHPTSWDPSRIAHLIDAEGGNVVTQCRSAGAPGRIQVTAYISRQGRVLNAGAAIDQSDAEQALDCVVEHVRAWRMPSSPRVAKVTFELPG